MLVWHLSILGCVTVIGVIGAIVTEPVGTLSVMGVANAILPQRVRDTVDMLIAFGSRNRKAE